MKIYSPPDNHILAKIQFTAKLSNTPLTHEVVPYGYKHKQFQEQHALSSTPSLQVSNSQFVFGTHSILRVLAPHNNLTPFQQALLNQWLQIIETQLQPAVGVLILAQHDLAEVQEPQLNRAKHTLVKVAKAMDQRLKTNTFLVGDSLTIADISSFFSWRQVSQSIEQEAKGLTSLARWAGQLASIPLRG